MAIEYENHCCGCASPGYPCMGNACPNRNVKVYYCDHCDPKNRNPLDEAYEVDDEILCAECVLDKFLIMKED